MATLCDKDRVYECQWKERAIVCDKDIECTNASRRKRYCATHKDRRFDSEFRVFNGDRDAHTKLCTFVSELFLTLN